MHVWFDRIEDYLSFCEKTWQDYRQEGLPIRAFVSSVLLPTVRLCLTGNPRFPKPDDPGFNRLLSSTVVLADGGVNSRPLPVETVIYAGSIGVGLDALCDAYDDGRSSAEAARLVHDAVARFQSPPDGLGDSDVNVIVNVLTALAGTLWGGENG